MELLSFHAPLLVSSFNSFLFAFRVLAVYAASWKHSHRKQKRSAPPFHFKAFSSKEEGINWMKDELFEKAVNSESGVFNYFLDKAIDAKRPLQFLSNIKIF